MSTLKVNTINAATSGQAVAVDIKNPRSFRNLIINGGAVVHQRGTSSVAVSDGNFIVDRFKFQNNGTLTGTGEQSSTVPDIANSSYFAKSIKVTSTGTTSSGSAGHYGAVSTRLERNDVANMGWGTSNAKDVTLSFYVRSSKTGVFSAYLIGADGFNRTYTFEYTISSADTWQKVEKTISGDTGGSWTYSSDNTIGLGVAFVLENNGSGAGTTSTLNSWEAGNNYAGSTNQVNLFDTNGATFYITGIQLEVGGVATDFEHRSYTDELARCQRYCLVTNVQNGDYAGFMCAAHSASDAVCIRNTPVAMRAEPTYTGTSTDCKIRAYNNSNEQPFNYFSMHRNSVTPNPSMICIRYENMGGMTEGQAGFLQATENNGKLIFSAEL